MDWIFLQRLHSIYYKIMWTMGGSPGLVVMGGDLQFKGCEFESHWMDLTFFHIDLLLKLYCLFEKDRK